MEEMENAVTLGETVLDNVKQSEVEMVKKLTGTKGVLIGASIVSGAWLAVTGYKKFRAWRKAKKAEEALEILENDSI